MTQNEFLITARIVVAILALLSFLVFGPGLISAASNSAVFDGIFLGGAAIFTAGLSLAKRFDVLYIKVYTMFRDAFSDFE